MSTRNAQRAGARWCFSVGLWSAIAVGTACVPARRASTSRPALDETQVARALDQQGVAEFEAGHYHDALLYFSAAFAHGGPPSERWNEAKCQLRLDETEHAEATLVTYLALPGLTADDRHEAEVALDALRHRPSTLTVLSRPLGLPVTVDGRKVGATPISLSVTAGEHVVSVRRANDSRDDQPVMARLGRAVILEAPP
jgi:hypothetical protein